MKRRLTSMLASRECTCAAVVSEFFAHLSWLRAASKVQSRERASFIFAIVHSAHATADRMSGERSDERLLLHRCRRRQIVLKVFPCLVPECAHAAKYGQLGAGDIERWRKPFFTFYPSVLQHAAETEGTKCRVKLRVCETWRACLSSWLFFPQFHFQEYFLKEAYVVAHIIFMLCWQTNAV